MEISTSDRFTSRIADYVRYRPDYPVAATNHLVAELGLGRGMRVADIGAGTGLLTLPLLRTGADVVAVDPNEGMLDAARVYLAEHGDVELVVGTAEETALADRSVDAITAGQAFHWFDHAAARREFERILAPGGRVALIWNSQAFGASDFLTGYEALLERLAPEFARVRHERTGEPETQAFYGGAFEVRSFPHAQRFDWEGVLGRASSSSYVPQAGTPNHDTFVAELRELFDRHARDGEIVWPYETRLYVGTLA